MLCLTFFDSKETVTLSEEAAQPASFEKAAMLIFFNPLHVQYSDGRTYDR